MRKTTVVIGAVLLGAAAYFIAAERGLGAEDAPPTTPTNAADLKSTESGGRTSGTAVHAESRKSATAYALTVTMSDTLDMPAMGRISGSLAVNGEVALWREGSTWALQVTSVESATRTLMGEDHELVSLSGLVRVRVDDGRWAIEHSDDASAELVRLARVLGPELAGAEGLETLKGKGAVSALTDHYTRAGDTITRTAREYGALAGETRLGTAARRSVVATATMRWSAGELAELQSDDRVAIVPARGAGGLSHRQAVTLRRVGAIARPAVGEIAFRPVDDPRHSAPTTAGIWRAAADGMTSQAVLAGVKGFTGKAKDMGRFVYQAHAVLMLEPALAKPLGRLAGDAAVPEPVRSLAVDLLVDAGHASAQAALRRAFEPTLKSPADRARLQRMVRLPRVESETLAMVADMASSDDLATRRAALPVYGTALRKSGEDISEAVAALIAREVNDPHERILTLAALGNTRHTLAYDALLAAMGSEVQSERQAAIRGLRHFDAVPALLAMLQADRRFKVQLDLSESLKRQEDVSRVLQGVGDVLANGGMNEAAFERWVGYLQSQAKDGHGAEVATVAQLMSSRTNAPPEVRSKLRFIATMAEAL